jgi:hypothetical protein
VPAIVALLRPGIVRAIVKEMNDEPPDFPERYAPPNSPPVT